MRKARQKSHISWTIELAAPWALGAALLVSFTAGAGQEVPSGGSRALISAHAAVMPRDIVPPSHPLVGAAHAGRGFLHEARLNLGTPDLLAAVPDEIDPRMDLKRGAQSFPQIDRSHKGDPVVGLRPTLDGRLRDKDGLAKSRLSLLAFTPDESGLASTFSAPEGDAPGPDSVAGFEPWLDGETPVNPGAGGATSPTQGGSGSTYRPAHIAEREAQGATPATPRAAALGSSTPFAADQTPVEVIAHASLRPAAKPQINATIVPRDDGKRNYLALIAPEKLEAEKKCLAQAIYFEARSEPEAGQAAVAQVILNRMTSGLYPESICGVVFQNRRHYHACQFSFACDGKSLRIREEDSWSQASRIADSVLRGETWLDDVGGSTHYHANYVRPRWARQLKKMDVIGKHIFYRLKG